MNQGSNFLGDSSSNDCKINVGATIQFRRESQPQHLKKWLFLKNRPIHFHINSSWDTMKTNCILLTTDNFRLLIQRYSQFRVLEKGLEIVSLQYFVWFSQKNVSYVIFKNKQAKPVDPTEMKNYQSNTYRKDLRWLHFDNHPRV